MDFFLWRSEYNEGVCVIKDPPLDAPWELDEGKPRLAEFPEEMPCAMSSSFPKDLALVDNLYGSTLTVVSARLRDVLLANAPHHRIEFLPVQIVNHKGRSASKDYFVLHPLEIVDCIDQKKSGLEWNQITANLINGCRGLVLNHEAIPESLFIFRLKYWGENIVVRQDLADKLTSAGLSGLSFLPVLGYTGIG